MVSNRYPRDAEQDVDMPHPNGADHLSEEDRVFKLSWQVVTGKSFPFFLLSMPH
jgi:hypothetical protein